MTAKTYLRQIRVLEKLIQSKQKELDLLWSSLSAQAVRYDGVAVKSSNISDPTAEMAVRHADLIRETDEQIDELIRLRHKITDEIGMVGDPRYIEILRLRYVECKTFEDIAEEMGFSIRHAARLHGGALQAFDRIVLRGEQNG